MGRRTRALVLVTALSVLVLALWVGWEFYQGPTVTRQLKPGDVVRLASNLGTATVPARWTGRVTTVRPDVVSWLRFKSSRTLSRQVVVLRSPDGVFGVTLDVVRGPGEYRMRQGAAVEQVRSSKGGFPSIEAVPASPGDSDYGGRARITVSDLASAATGRGTLFTLFVWDRSAPFVLTVRQRASTSGVPGTVSFARYLVGLRAFDFAPASR